MYYLELAWSISSWAISELRYALNRYINQFYNHKRLHSGIGLNPLTE